MFSQLTPNFSILFIISSMGNITVLSMLFNRKRSSRIDLLLINLAIADLFVAFLLLPVEVIWNWTVEWPFTDYLGDITCRMFMYFRVYGLYLSSFIIVCIAIDRWVWFYAIPYKNRFHLINNSNIIYKKHEENMTLHSRKFKFQNFSAESD